MKSRFATLLLLTWLAQGAATEEWAKKENQEPDPGRPLGWRFEVPASWRKTAVANFPYPLGEAWNGTEGGFRVCWLGETPKVGQEQINLLNRGFSREEKRVAGREAVLLQKANELYCYVKATKGSCRLHITGGPNLSEHILNSFTLVDLADTALGGEQKYSDWSFELPPGWKWQDPDLLVADGEPVARLASYPVPRDMMVRGWARNQASQENPKLKERVEMEPFTSKRGIDGYLVEWKGPTGASLLFAYAALKQKGLRVELLRTSELDKLRRLLSSLQFKG